MIKNILLFFWTYMIQKSELALYKRIIVQYFVIASNINISIKLTNYENNIN